MSASALADDEPTTIWTVGYAPEPDDDGDRFILAYLRIAGSDCEVDVEIAGTIVNGPEGDIQEGTEGDEFAAALLEIDSLEALYNVARITARALLGTIEVEAEIPLASPPVEITQLVRSADSSDAPESKGI